MGKNMKLRTKLTSSYIILEVMVVIILYMGYNGITTIAGLPEAQQASYITRYSIITAVIFVLMMAVIGAISIELIRTFRTSMASLQAAAGAMAKGQIDVTVEKRGNDEFGELIDDVGQLVQGIAYQADVAKEVADGNMAVDVKPRSEVDVLGIALQQMVSKNRMTLGNIKEAAYQVTTSASQVASASEALAQGSTEQASAIEEITASIDDVAEETKQNASQANVAADMMSKTITEVRRGNEEMQQMVVAMKEINDSSENISKIIKVIDDIAFQTNILALNAAVEAARAGDAGKGFAVVAEEVRNLAAKSAAAAAETAEMIEDSIRKVETGSRIADGTAKALGKITEDVKESEDIVAKIAEASNYQATAIAQIDKAIEQVSQVVQTNSATSEECAAASVELSNQASRMRDLISIYRLGDENSVYMEIPSATNYHHTSSDNEQIISLGDGFGKY